MTQSISCIIYSDLLLNGVIISMLLILLRPHLLIEGQLGPYKFHVYSTRSRVLSVRKGHHLVT